MGLLETQALGGDGKEKIVTQALQQFNLNCIVSEFEVLDC